MYNHVVVPVAEFIVSGGGLAALALIGLVTVGFAYRTREKDIPERFR